MTQPPDNVIDGPWRAEPPSDTEVIVTLEEPLVLDEMLLAEAAQDTAVMDAIKAAAHARLDRVVILGIDKFGELFVEYDRGVTSMEANWIMSTALFELHQEAYGK